MELDEGGPDREAAGEQQSMLQPVAEQRRVCEAVDSELRGEGGQEAATEEDESLHDSWYGGREGSDHENSRENSFTATHRQLPAG